MEMQSIEIPKSWGSTLLSVDPEEAEIYRTENGGLVISYGGQTLLLENHKYPMLSIVSGKPHRLHFIVEMEPK